MAENRTSLQEAMARIMGLPAGGNPQAQENAPSYSQTPNLTPSTSTSIANTPVTTGGGSVTTEATNPALQSVGWSGKWTSTGPGRAVTSFTGLAPDSPAYNQALTNATKQYAQSWLDTQAQLDRTVNTPRPAGQIPTTKQRIASDPKLQEWYDRTSSEGAMKRAAQYGAVIGTEGGRPKYSSGYIGPSRGRTTSNYPGSGTWQQKAQYWKDLAK